MASILANAGTLGRFAIDAWRRRRAYVSWRHAYRAFNARLSVTNFGKRLIKPGVTRLELKAARFPLFVRRTESDVMIVEDIFHHREYGPVERWGLPGDARIVDLGANVGIASVYFASICPDAHLVAVEPDAGNRSMIEMNCAPLIAAGRMAIVPGFVAATDGEAAIDRSTVAMGFTKVSADAASADAERIPCFSMRSVLDRLPPGPVDLLKCDVEGSERELFADCASWIGRIRRIVVETHPPYSPADFYRDLDASGWKYRKVAEAHRPPWADCFVEAVDAGEPPGAK